MMNFTREQQQKRIERFLSFLEEHNLWQYEVIYKKPGKTFIVHNESDLTRINLGSMGGIQLIARNGQLKKLLCTWIAQERPSFEDRVEPEDFAALDEYRYLLQAPQDLPPSEATQLLTGDHPLNARETSMQQRRAVDAPQGRKILQIIPAQPDWWAVFAAAWNVEQGEDAYYTAPLIGWVMVEEGNETEVVAMFVFPADSDSEPDPQIWLVGGKTDGFLGFQYPGNTTNWNTYARNHRKAYLDEHGEPVQEHSGGTGIQSASCLETSEGYEERGRENTP